MANPMVTASRVERPSRTSGLERTSPYLLSVAREYDDGLDFPPAAYPGRELFSFAVLSVTMILAVVWGGWKLISFWE
jgi:hypothetical protein